MCCGINTFVPKNSTLAKMKKLAELTLVTLFWMVKKMEYFILSFLVLLMGWFINGVWFSESYTPPTRSVCWIGVVLGIVLWIIYSERTDRYGHPRGSKAFSKTYRFGMATTILFLNLVYLVLPTYARSYVNEQGRYWKISPIFGNKEGVYTLDFSAESAWPRWSFLQKATDPFSLPNSSMPCKADECGCKPVNFCWIKDVTQQDYDLVPGFRCDITISYSYWAMESVENALALRDHPVSTDDVDRLIWKELGGRIRMAASSGFGSCKLDTETEVSISGSFDPLKTLSPQLNLSSRKLKCSYRLVQVV